MKAIIFVCAVLLMACADSNPSRYDKPQPQPETCYSESQTQELNYALKQLHVKIQDIKEAVDDARYMKDGIALEDAEDGLIDLELLYLKILELVEASKD